MSGVDGDVDWLLGPTRSLPPALLHGHRIADDPYVNDLGIRCSEIVMGPCPVCGDFTVQGPNSLDGVARIEEAFWEHDRDDHPGELKAELLRWV